MFWAFLLFTCLLVMLANRILFYLATDSLSVVIPCQKNSKPADQAVYRCVADCLCILHVKYHRNRSSFVQTMVKWSWNVGLFFIPNEIWVSEWVSRGLTSHSTLYRSFRGRFLQDRWPNQQRPSTEGSQLATEIGFSPTRTTPLCYNINCRQPL